MADVSISDHKDPELQARLLDQSFAPLSPVSRLRALRQAVEGPVIFTTSFGLEDQVLTHLIARSSIDVRIVTLDTGRLFPETWQLWAETERHFGISVHGYSPEAASLESLVRRDGADGFYRSREARKACCDVRKVEPLGRALRGAAGWITGLRAEQSAARQVLGFVSWEADRQLIKANPLLDWSREKLLSLVRAGKIPVNPLHDRGYLSIGCAPCTRAVRPGEPERAGRWWWEDQGSQECGLHVTEDGRLVRASAAE